MAKGLWQEIGGFAVHSSGKRVVICVTIDNLLKGAATQCLRKCSGPHNLVGDSTTDTFPENMNLALGYDEYEGIPL